MATTPPSRVMNEFWERYVAIEAQRETSNGLLKDVIAYCQMVETTLQDENTRLAKKFQDTDLDLQDAIRSRRDMQLELNKMNSRMELVTAEYDSLRNRNPYIMVLIDGDGTIFDENLISQGLEGGKQAASALRNAVLQQCHELADDIEVIAKVCANISGLSKAMRRDGSLANSDDLRDFTLGFTQGKASFDFVDVGHGKERADSKIKECMRWHLRNHNCKQIILGISHDAGYAPFLDEVVGQHDRGRVAILEGFPVVRELSALGLEILKFDNLFRAEKLVDRSDSHPSPSSTWANVTSIAPPAPDSSIVKPGSPLTINKKTTTPITAQKLKWAPHPRGLDPPINVSTTILEDLKRRPNNKKFCNNHYLRGPCAKGSDCTYEHVAKPTKEELKAIEYLTRLNPCLNGQDCEQDSCIYGHHCPSVVLEKGQSNPVCNAFGCRFRSEDHPPNTLIRMPRRERTWNDY